MCSQRGGGGTKPRCSHFPRHFTRKPMSVLVMRAADTSTMRLFGPLCSENGGSVDRTRGQGGERKKKKEKNPWVLVSPPTDYGDVACKGSVGVAETPVAPEAPGAKPVQGGGAELRGHAGGGGQRLCGQGKRRGRRGPAGAERSWNNKRACVNQYLVPLRYAFPVYRSPPGTHPWWSPYSGSQREWEPLEGHKNGFSTQNASVVATVPIKSLSKRTGTSRWF